MASERFGRVFHHCLNRAVWSDELPVQESNTVIRSSSGDVTLRTSVIMCSGEAYGNQRTLIGRILTTGWELLSDEVRNGITAPTAGGYALVMGTTAFSSGLTRGGADYLLLKLDVDGNPLWGSVIGGPAPDEPTAIVEMSGGGFAVFGSTISHFLTPMRWLTKGPRTALLGKFDSEGELKWANYWKLGDEALPLGLIPTADGGVAVNGVFHEGKQWMGFVGKTAIDGKPEWLRSYGRDREDGITRLVQLADGGFLAAGVRQESRGSEYRVLLARIAANGTVNFAKDYRVPLGGASINVVPTDDGGILVFRKPDIVQNPTVTRVPVMKLDGKGEVVWAYSYSLDQKANFRAISTAPDGGVLLVGTGGVSEPYGFVYSLRLDRAGEIISASVTNIKTVVTEKDQVVSIDIPMALTATKMGGFLASGNILTVPQGLYDEAQKSNSLPSAMKSASKFGTYFVALDKNGSASKCSAPITVKRESLDIKGGDFELSSKELGLGQVSFIPSNELAFQRLGPPRMK